MSASSLSRQAQESPGFSCGEDVKEAIVIFGLRPSGFTGDLSTEALINAARDRCLPAFEHTTVDQRLMASLELDRAHIMRGQRLAWVLTARPAYEAQAHAKESDS